MCKLNLSNSMALILMAASLSCSIALRPHAKADEITTAGGSKLPSTSDTPELKSSALEASKALSTGETQDIVMEGELGGAGVPLTKPKPNDIVPPYWTRIAPGDTHFMEMKLVGWTVFSLQAQEGSVLNVFIYDADWNLLAEFDSTGCGAFLQVDPQSATVMIQNGSKDMPSKYILNIYE